MAFVALALASVVARAQPPEAGVDRAVLDAGLDGTLDGALDAVVLDAGLDAGDSVLQAGADGGGDARPEGATDAEGPEAPEATLDPEPTALVVRTVLGLVLLLGLAYLGSHPLVRRLEDKLGLSQLMTTGLPFVGLGLLARAPGIDVLSPAVIERLSPLLQIGLGWIGVLSGFGFSGRGLDELPRGTPAIVAALSGVPAALIALACGGMLYALGSDPEGWVVARDAVMVGLAGSLASGGLGATLRRAGLTKQGELARQLGHVEVVVVLVGLLLLGAYLRPRTASVWSLPGTGWLFVTLGMGATLGLLAWVLLRRQTSAAESRTLLLGTVAFASGMASYLRMSPLVVCFIAGVVLRNLPGLDTDRLRASFERLERPIYLTFLVIAGALWDVSDGRGWLLLPAFLGARWAGRWLGLRLARRADLDDDARELLDEAPRALIFAPMSPLSVAMIASVSVLYVSHSIRLLPTPVIVGAALSEVLIQLLSLRSSKAARA